MAREDRDLDHNFDFAKGRHREGRTMAKPTSGELLHSSVVNYMICHLVNIKELEGVPVGIVRQIAFDAAGVAKRFHENPKTDQQ